MKKVKTSKLLYLNYGLVGLVALIAILNVFSISSVSSAVDAKIRLAEGLSKPALIEIAVLANSDCDSCFDVSPLVEEIKRKKVNITNEGLLSFNSENYAALIKKYGIEKIPAVIITGEIGKLSLPNFNKKGDALIFEASNPPYIDAITNQVKGLVDSIIVQDSSCEQCADLDLLVAQLKQGGVVVNEEEMLEFDSSEGKKLIGKYSIKKLPALLLSPDVKEYSAVSEALPQIGSIEEDGWFVMREIPPPYIDLNTARITGLIKLISVTDKSCDDCYDVSIHKQILSRLGVVINEEEEMDISSRDGKKLIEEYGINAVPTIIIQGDTEEYPTLNQVWSQVGTVEEDGSYIFRKIEAMGQGIKYKDLQTNSVIDNSQG